MAKFPTEVTESVVIPVPLADAAYAFFWDVPTSARCIPGLDRVDADHTRVALQQMLAPDTPVPRLLQGLIKSFVQGAAAKAASDYLANVTRVLGDTRA